MLTKWDFQLQNGKFVYKVGFSITKWDSCFTNVILVLQFITENYHVEETLPDDDAVMLYETNSDINLSLRMDDSKEEKEN